MVNIGILLIIGLLGFYTYLGTTLKDRSDKRIWFVIAILAWVIFLTILSIGL